MSVCIEQLAENHRADSCCWPRAHCGPEENIVPPLHVELKIKLNHHFGDTECVGLGRAEVTAWDLLGLDDNRGLQKICEASLVVQWLRIHLPMQGTWVQALVWEDPTCRRETKPVCRNYWACALKPMSHNYWTCMLQLLKPVCLEPVPHNKRSHRNEKPTHRNEE